MKITANKQSRLRHYIGAPKRFLLRARDLYVDSMLSFDGKVGSANVMACPATHITNLPKEFGGYRSTTKWDDNENLEELYRSISKKFNWGGMESDKPGLNVRGRQINAYYGMNRSYSIALGKIGTIDEEEQCDFQEEVTTRSENFSRSRSHAAVTKSTAKR
ncbi:hypothetical protein DH2020_032754 [Rehmannia glutinosa]|uniref:Uncharacterized protein n=1 Tax=Rehmannia glutinosa TaxID=99300 RepID=A0ABR0VE99_REHGL